MNNETVISQQPSAVQNLCKEFTQSYQKNRKLIGSWGKLLQEIRDGLTVSVDFTESSDPHGSTFTAICRELGIPRSTAYHYINMFLISSTYPQWLQDAATVGNLNLSLKHVQDAYEDMRETLPTDPNAFEVQGIIGKLKEAKPPKVSRPSMTEADFLEELQDLAARAKKAGIAAATVNNLLEQAIVAAYGDATNMTREVAPIYLQGQK
jgi:hypothetical protein